MPRLTSAKRVKEELGDRYTPELDHLIAVYRECEALASRLRGSARGRKLSAAAAAEIMASIRQRVRILRLLGLTAPAKEEDDGQEEW